MKVWAKIWISGDKKFKKSSLSNFVLALSRWWERKCFSLHFSHSLKILALYVISFVVTFFFLVHLTMSRSVWVSRILCQRSSTDRCHAKSRWFLFCAWLLTVYTEHRFVPAALHFISVLPLVAQRSSRDVFLLQLSINVLKFGNHTIGICR